MTKIFIDPGHGGSDPGAIGNGLKEKDLTLKIAKKIQALLLDGYKNVSVKLSRTGDTYPTLTQRAVDANKWGADFFLSVHINAGGGTGYEDFRYSKTAASSATGKHQSCIHGEIVNAIKSFGVTVRGKKAADYAVLRQTNMPAILTENLFIDRAADAKCLKNEKFLDAVAQGHVDGLAKTLKLEKAEPVKAETNTNKTSESSDTYTIKKGDTFWSIAQKENTTVEQLRKWNPSVNEKKLQIGDKLQFGEKDDTYKIKKGDTFWSIEEELKLKHGSLTKLNPKINPKELKVGQSIKVQ
ncbi:LysM peptidoglycan-binding domain-containing protein [Niallia circulans]|uniref:LysM peptidoglycan-binding domain-containing protein n=1 Tax=Niallia circulans TaxID=1397 RepID=A0A553SNG6_NIACI|nr:N-acetylmuramoyl-L-alanine amidase [Niallia circulans]TRZ38517.1 LysM peptidoglycan-binding domain-containing protein [Niallia circulans]